MGSLAFASERCPSGPLFKFDSLKSDWPIDDHFLKPDSLLESKRVPSSTNCYYRRIITDESQLIFDIIIHLASSLWFLSIEFVATRAFDFEKIVWKIFFDVQIFFEKGENCLK